ncbi:RES domain-containing protein [Gynuella sp.]|uniref:RES domain-containing protein n=1 Tax=Gynuella sp. TaxID=2969146 RepID=UPI003D0B264F
MQSYEAEEVDNQNICSQCIGESFLKNLVEKSRQKGRCSYCAEEGFTISLEDMANHIEQAFEKHYIRTSTEPDSFEYAMMRDEDFNYSWERQGDSTIDVIGAAADIPYEAAEDIQKILENRHSDFDSAAMGEECEFDSDAHYIESMPDSGEWYIKWQQFEKTVKYEARFFSRTASAQLSELFDTIDEMHTESGQPLIISAGPHSRYTHLFRARVFQSDDELIPAMIRPDIELGAPPSRLAGAGRMNAQGISVFYGATSVEVALAEVRPPVGSQVATVRFEITRPIRLLDLTALNDVHETGSIFDQAFANRLSRMTFLRTLTNHIARPVMPNNQLLEYLPTQAVSDFLATEGKVPIDGILYPSVQVGGNGFNVVLFYKAARCKRLDFPEGTELRADTYIPTDEGPERSYSVLEITPLEADNAQTRAFPNNPDDIREETLSVDKKSMTVHLINAVKIHSDEHTVQRYQRQQCPPKF